MVVKVGEPALGMLTMGEGGGGGKFPPKIGGGRLSFSAPLGVRTCEKEPRGGSGGTTSTLEEAEEAEEEDG